MSYVGYPLTAVICVNPPDEYGKPYKAWRLRDSPAAVEALKADAVEAGEIPAGLDSVLADALVAYQQGLIAAINDIHEQLNATAGSSEVVARSDSGTHPLAGRLETLEKGGKKIKDSLAILEKEVVQLASKVDELGDGRKPVLQSVYNSVIKNKKAKRKPKTKAVKARAETTRTDSYDVRWLLLGVAVLGVVGYVVRRRRGGRDLDLKAR